MTEACLCPHCGAKMVDYRFGFNKGLSVFLGRLYENKGKACKTDNLGLTYSQRTNSQKLAYWGLAVPVKQTEEQSKKRGWWAITQKGIDFIEGRISIPKHAITRRGDIVGFEGEQIYLEDVKDGYQFRYEFKEQARSQLSGDGQTDLMDFLKAG